MRDARREVIQEARRRRGELALEALHELLARELGQHRAGSLVGSERPGFDFAPALLRHFTLEVADLMCETSLAQALREDFLHRADQPWRAVSGD